MVGLVIATPGALFMVATFADDWTTKPHMMGTDVWGPRIGGAFFLLFGGALMLVAPSEWFKTPRWPRRRPRLH